MAEDRICPLPTIIVVSLLVAIVPAAMMGTVMLTATVVHAATIMMTVVATALPAMRDLPLTTILPRRVVAVTMIPIVATTLPLLTRIRMADRTTALPLRETFLQEISHLKTVAATGIVAIVEAVMTIAGKY